MRYLIAGDFVVNKYCGAEACIDSSVSDFFRQADYRIVNLEAAITDSDCRIVKVGPHLKAHRESTHQTLTHLGIDAVTMANNHILDFDEQGVEDSLSFCADNGITTVGAGMNRAEAAQTRYIDSQEGRIALVNFAENEWANATVRTAGANPMDIIDNAKQIQAARQEADWVFAIIHGGHEYYNLPSPRMQKQYRFYAEQGADIVVGHHTHCISGFDVHRGTPIYYSLGNFLFTKDSPHEDWYQGLVLEVELNRDGLAHEVHPVQMEKRTFRLSLNTGASKAAVLDRVADYSRTIRDPALVQQAWQNYVREKTPAFLLKWSPLAFIKNRYVKGILRRLKLTFINSNGLKIYLNHMRCEAHRDLSYAVIRRRLEVPDPDEPPKQTTSKVN